MSAPQLRIVRRSRGSGFRHLTAASAPVKDPATAFKSSMASRGGDWQSEAWDMLDAVGELRYYVGWRAGSCSRAKLIASDIDPDTGLPTGNTENPRVAEIVKAIAGGPLGQSQLIKRAVECLTVPGETWLAIIQPPEGGEKWLALSREEIKTTGRSVQIELPTGDKYELNMSTDTIFRVWNPRPRRASEADSPVRATLDSLKEIVRTTKTISNASKSRLIGNGVVFVPQEMSLPSMQSPLAAPGSGAGPEFIGTPAVQQLQDLLFQVAQVAYDDEDSMAALIPMFAGVPGEQVKNVSHLKFDNTVTDIAIKTRNDAIARLAMGLDVSPERLLGLGSNSNHWSAWEIADDDVRLHLVPPLETVIQAINDQVFRVVLEREGIDPEKHILWYDVSVLTADPDLGTEAQDAFDRGVITGEAYREFLGLGDTGYDLSSIQGWQEWARDRVSQKPELLPTLLPLLDQLEGIVEQPSAPAPAIEPPPQDAPPPADGVPHSEPQTEDQAQENPGGVGKAQAAVVEILVSRALELAGKRRRTRADYTRLRDIPMHQTHRAMGPVGDAEVSGLIKGWDSALEEDTLALIGLDIAEVRAEVYRQVRHQLTRPMVEV